MGAGVRVLTPCVHIRQNPSCSRAAAHNITSVLSSSELVIMSPTGPAHRLHVMHCGCGLQMRSRAAWQQGSKQLDMQGTSNSGRTHSTPAGLRKGQDESKSTGMTSPAARPTCRRCSAPNMRRSHELCPHDAAQMQRRGPLAANEICDKLARRPIPRSSSQRSCAWRWTCSAQQKESV
jgi:hypothetical protein